MKLLYPFGILESSRSGTQSIVLIADDRNDGVATDANGCHTRGDGNREGCRGYCGCLGSSTRL